MSVITNNQDRYMLAESVLKEVKDPEIGLNIVDLGLIYQVDFDEPLKKVYARMTLTTQFCPMGNSLLEAARQALQLAFPGEKVEISLTFDPRWNTERISDQGKIFLKR